MPTDQLTSVEEYLHTTYEPDAEYVEGRIVHRPLPLKPHSKMQRFLIHRVGEMTQPPGYEAWPEDLFTEPPFLCIEILSPDSRRSEVLEKVDEYLQFGVEYAWVIDPESLQGEIHTRQGKRPVLEGVFRAGKIAVDASEF